jgi:dihydroxyacid dehydratase/phosphogluconate dehydratase
MTKTAAELRSARWFAPDGFRGFGHRSRFMQTGDTPADWAGKPVIAIVNTWSDAKSLPDFLETSFGAALSEAVIF